MFFKKKADLVCLRFWLICELSEAGVEWEQSTYLRTVSALREMYSRALEQRKLLSDNVGALAAYGISAQSCTISIFNIPYVFWTKEELHAINPPVSENRSDCVAQGYISVSTVHKMKRGKQIIIKNQNQNQAKRVNPVQESSLSSQWFLFAQLCSIVKMWLHAAFDKQDCHNWVSMRR